MAAHLGKKIIKMDSRSHGNLTPRSGQSDALTFGNEVFFIEDSLQQVAGNLRP